MSKKNLARLTPIKKNVIDTRTNTPVTRTYYIDGRTKIKKDRTKKSEEPSVPSTHTKTEDTNLPAHINTDEPIAPAHTKIEDEVGNTPASTEISSTDIAKKSLTPKKKGEGLDLTSIKNFDDFGRQGVDPAVAKQFFCNM